MDNINTINLSNSYIETKGDIHIWRHRESASVNMCKHLHTYNEMEIVISGIGVNEYRNLNTPLTVGSAYIIPPYISHRIDMHTDFDIVTVSFNDRLIKYPNLLHKIKSGANYIDLSQNQLILVNKTLEKIQSLMCSDEAYSEELISSLFNTLIIEILKASRVYNPYDLDNDVPQKLKSAISYINNNFSRNISLYDVATAVKLSPNHLSATFKKYLGISYIDYLCEKRLEYSKTLMTDTVLSINKIGNLVGFNSPAYFAQSFKRRFGLSPMKYRMEIK